MSALSARRACLRLVAATLALLPAALLAFAAPAHAERDIPVGSFDVNNSQLAAGPQRMYAIRFVLDQGGPVGRFWSGMNWEGVYVDRAGGPAPDEIRSSERDKGYPAPPTPALPPDWQPGGGRPFYASGNGGMVRARLVAMNADGTPNLGAVLAEETWGALDRYREIKAQYGFSGRAGMTYSNFGGVRVAAGVPYFVVYDNVDPDPRANFVSLNSPVVAQSAAGPNGRNTLDARAPGAIAGLDPREAVAWTTNGGQSWGWGHDVGAGDVPGDYTGSGDDAVKLPWYAWQESASGPLHSNQPFYSYRSEGSFTLRLKSSPHTVNLRQAGGYAPSGASVGVVTVTNLRTGESARTAPLGGGLVHGALSRPIHIETGDSYEISNTGTVAKAEGDVFLQKMGLVGPGHTPYETVGHEYDRAELFALPHPWFMRGPRAARHAGVYVTRAIVRRVRSAGASSSARRLGAPERVSVSGRAVKARPARHARVRLQLRSHKHWRTVSKTRLRKRGRFALHTRVRASRVVLRAVVAGVGHSRVIRLRVR